MSEAEAESSLPMRRTRRIGRLWPARWRWRISLILFLILLILVIAGWSQREKIAGNLIDDALQDLGVDAEYDIISISPNEQVIENFVIGEPDAPNLTIERMVIDIDYAFGSPQIGQVSIEDPRLYGTYLDGELSFGALDPLIFAESEEPAGLPKLDVAIRDGRALIESDYGAVGVKLDGVGRLDDGFVGTIAATAPGIGTDQCRLTGATLYGQVTTNNGRPNFDGPVRLRDLDCEDYGLGSSDIAADLTLEKDFSALEGAIDFGAKELNAGNVSLSGLQGVSNLTLGLNNGPDGGLGNLALDHDLEASDLETAGVKVGNLNIDGTLRAREGFANGDWNADFDGQELSFDAKAREALASARKSAEGTLAAPLLARLERGLSRSLTGGSFAGGMTVRTNAENTSFVLPEGRVRSAGGDTVLALSRISYSSRTERLSGNLLTGGADIPRINGRIEQVAGGNLALRMMMEEYRSDNASLAIPRMLIERTPSGRFTFNGLVEANGGIPGGEVRGLLLPVEGRWTDREGLAVGTRCTEMRVASLRYYQLGLQGRSLTMCPEDGKAMLTYRDTLELAVAGADIDLSGDLAGTPAFVTADRAVLRYPGPFLIEGLTAVLGPDDNAIRLSMGALKGEFAQGIGGRFEGGTAGLAAVPMDLSDLEGSWGYEDSVLSIADAAFTLTERTGPGLAPEARFEPLIARGATLTLAENVITAQAPMRLTEAGQLITEVSIRHDLSTAVGYADIDVPGVVFGDALQPEDLSYLASGVIALAEGTVSGEGRIGWTGDDISSSGAFRSESFDFAAAFGPARGVSGEIVFTDLINLTTAPSQRIEIGAINPGIEVLGGSVTFSMTDGQIIRVEEGRWPFMGGTLLLRSTTVDFAGGGGQSYVYEIIGLDAATFVSQMELSNLGATGTFDGTIPIYFDEEGNGLIQGGLLISRPPGGNVAYVGELTYEDLGTMANYAFQTLRSLDYNQMSVELNGSLAGEIITNFNIDGVRQGEGADRNFITRQLEDLPIRFIINVRSDNFANLALIVRGMFDPTVFDTEAARRGIGLDLAPYFAPRLFSEEDEDPPEPSDDGPEQTDDQTDDQRRDEPAVQPPESDELP